MFVVTYIPTEELKVPCMFKHVRHTVSVLTQYEFVVDSFSSLLYNVIFCSLLVINIIKLTYFYIYVKMSLITLSST